MLTLNLQKCMFHLEYICMSENCQGAMMRGFPVGETEHTVVKVKVKDGTIKYRLRCTECRVEERVEGINYSCVSFPYLF